MGAEGTPGHSSCTPLLTACSTHNHRLQTHLDFWLLFCFVLWTRLSTTDCLCSVSPYANKQKQTVRGSIKDSIKVKKWKKKCIKIK